MEYSLGGLDAHERALLQRKVWADEIGAEVQPSVVAVQDALASLTALYAEERRLYQAKIEAAKLRDDIATEAQLRELDKGKDGKINGSNQAIRDMQTAMFLKSLNGDYKDAVEQADALEREYGSLKVQIDLAEKNLSAHTVLLKLATAKLNSLGG